MNGILNAVETTVPNVHYKEWAVPLDLDFKRKNLDRCWNRFGHILKTGRTTGINPHHLKKARVLLAFYKLPALVKAAQEADAGTVIFTDHVALLRPLEFVRGFEALKTNRIVDQLNRFKSGEIKGLGLCIGTHATGFQLPTCRRMIFADANLRPNWNVQAIGRCMMVGRTKPVEIIRMVADHILDRTLADRIPGGWTEQSRRHYN